MAGESEKAELAATFYYQARLIRRVEETLLELFHQGLLAGTVHTSIGQEVCAVGVLNAIDRQRDVVFSNHRAHGHFIAYCDLVEPLIAEIMGRSTGLLHGIGGTQHLHYRNFYTNGIQGGIVPNAVGAAFAEKYHGTGAVVLVFLGDGTLAQGAVYESFNIASLWQLPVLFVVEDNQYAQSTHKSFQHAGDMERRAEPFGIPVATIQAEDVFAVYQTTRSIVTAIRDDSSPRLLYVHTYRLAPHSKGDDFRSAEELAFYRQRDPLVRLAAALPPADRAGIDAQVEQRIQCAVKVAMQADFLHLDTFLSLSHGHH